jgi:hypothetical protein
MTPFSMTSGVAPAPPDPGSSSARAAGTDPGPPAAESDCKSGTATAGSEPIVDLVFDVSVPVMGRDFWLFELDVSSPARTTPH